MFRHATQSDTRHDATTPRTVRVLRSDAELAEASARAAEHARRLRDRLEARAARDAKTAGYRSVEEAPVMEGKAEVGESEVTQGATRPQTSAA